VADERIYNVGATFRLTWAIYLHMASCINETLRLNTTNKTAHFCSFLFVDAT